MGSGCLSRFVKRVVGACRDEDFVGPLAESDNYLRGVFARVLGFLWQSGSKNFYTHSLGSDQSFGAMSSSISWLSLALRTLQHPPVLQNMTSSHMRSTWIIKHTFLVPFSPKLTSQACITALRFERH